MCVCVDGVGFERRKMKDDEKQRPSDVFGRICQESPIDDGRYFVCVWGKKMKEKHVCVGKRRMGEQKGTGGWTMIWAKWRRWGKEDDRGRNLREKYDFKCEQENAVKGAPLAFF